MVFEVHTLLVLKVFKTVQVSLLLQQMCVLLKEHSLFHCLLLDLLIHSMLLLHNHLILFFIAHHFVGHVVTRLRWVIVMSFGSCVTAITVV
jgi:hypothetical protein